MLSQQTGGMVNNRQSSGNPQFNVKSSNRNAASRQNGTGSESNVVKSLLTGQKYVQQPSGRQQKVPSKLIHPQEDLTSSTQDVMLADIPTNLAPGEKLYAVLDGVTYEITAGANQELIARPANESFSAVGGVPNSNISLEDLATISAEQETLKLVDGSNNVAGLSVLTGGAGDQLLQQQQLINSNHLVSGNEDPNAMQILIVPNESGGASQKVIDQTTGVAGIQDFILQPGQQIPAELQEMIARGGLGGLDLSNYEFVIQEEGDAQQGQQQQQQIFVTTGANGQIDASALQEMLQQHQQQQYLGNSNTVINPNDVLALLAEASSAVAQHESSAVLLGAYTKPGSLMAPEDEDDGEFAFVKVDSDDETESRLVTDANTGSIPPVVLNDGYSQAFASFVQGNKPETLASVANSAIIKKPPLPPYIPEFCPIRRTASGSGIQGKGLKQKKLYNDSTSYSVMSSAEKGRSFVEKYTGNAANYNAKRKEMMSRIISRKTRGSDDDSYDDMDFNEDALGSDSDVSDPGWKPSSLDNARKAHQQLMALSSVKSHRGRGRGRPRGSRGGMSSTKHLMKDDKMTLGSLSTSVSQINKSVILSTPTEPHCYQKGDFVLERKDYYKKDSFPIWKIEAGRLLQKFDPVQVEGRLLHKSASIYSSWSGDIRTSFKAILVDVINTTGRRQEMVRVIEEFLPKPFDESLEQDALIDLFNIYVQNLLSQSLDQSFMTAIHVQNEDYYLGPLKQIDALLFEAEQTITTQVNWTNKFKEMVDQLPCFRISELVSTSGDKYCCQATDDNTQPAVKIANFYGPVYNPDVLEVIKEVDASAAESFLIGQQTASFLPTYHALHHFKFLLYKSSQEEVNYRRMQSKDKQDEIILADCLQNRIWVQQHLRNLKELLQKCSIVITVVTKSEEDEQQRQPLVKGDHEQQPQLQQTQLDVNPDSTVPEQQQQQQQQPHELMDTSDMDTSTMNNISSLSTTLATTTATIGDSQMSLIKEEEQHSQQQQLQQLQQQHLTLMQVDENGAIIQMDPNSAATMFASGDIDPATAAAYGQTIGLVQLEDGSIVQAVYDANMMSLLQQQQLEQQQQLDQQHLLDQQQLLEQQHLLEQQQQHFSDLTPDQQQQLLEQQQQLLEQQLLLEQQQQQQQLLFSQQTQQLLDEHQQQLLLDQQQQLLVGQQLTEEQQQQLLAGQQLTEEQQQQLLAGQQLTEEQQQQLLLQQQQLLVQQQLTDEQAQQLLLSQQQQQLADEQQQMQQLTAGEEEADVTEQKHLSDPRQLLAESHQQFLTEQHMLSAEQEPSQQQSDEQQHLPDEQQQLTDEQQHLPDEQQQLTDEHQQQSTDECGQINYEQQLTDEQFSNEQSQQRQQQTTNEEPMDETS